jgi:alkylhydroperoxidase family enzyme
MPTLDGLPFFRKPPPFYWITAAAMGLLGEHPWTARLASMLAATEAALALYWFNHSNSVRWKTSLDGRLREIVIIRLGYLTGSQYVLRQQRTKAYRRPRTQLGWAANGRAGKLPPFPPPVGVSHEKRPVGFEKTHWLTVHEKRGAQHRRNSGFQIPRVQSQPLLGPALPARPPTSPRNLITDTSSKTYLSQIIVELGFSP